MYPIFGMVHPGCLIRLTSSISAIRIQPPRLKTTSIGSASPLTVAFVAFRLDLHSTVYTLPFSSSYLDQLATISARREVRVATDEHWRVFPYVVSVGDGGQVAGDGAWHATNDVFVLLFGPIVPFVQVAPEA